jgi:hypothetical protein
METERNLEYEKKEDNPYTTVYPEGIKDEIVSLTMLAEDESPNNKSMRFSSAKYSDDQPNSRRSGFNSSASPTVRIFNTTSEVQQSRNQTCYRR